jgi:hypothetical protein
VTKSEEHLDKLPPLVPAVVEFVDIAGLVKGASTGEGLGNKFLSHIREVTVIVNVVRLMEAGDIFAFGGFCILGRHKRLLPKFIASLRLVLPMLQAQGVKRAHLLGICWAPALEVAERERAGYDITFTTDSSSLEMNSIMGRVWRDRQWHKTYSKEDKGVNYHPVDLTMANIERFTAWLKSMTENPCATP